MVLKARLREPIRVLLVDHPGLSRHGLVALLARRRGLRVVGEADTGLEALALARAVQPDVVIVETSVPGGGVKLVTDLAREQRQCAVLVLTETSSDPAVSRALQAGARGYLQKSCEPDDLVRTIERVHLGELVVAAHAAPVLYGHGRSQGPPEGLTERELEVLRLVARGRTNPGIAQELGITEHTAKEHLANILDKLGLENRVQVATYAVHHGLAAMADN
jgi:two-component system nitrate/nitrite response regulator NarL